MCRDKSYVSFNFFEEKIIDTRRQIYARLEVKRSVEMSCRMISLIRKRDYIYIYMYRWLNGSDEELFVLREDKEE